MFAPEPVIRYSPVEALNSAEPLIAGSPTSPEPVNTPRLALCPKAETQSRNAVAERRTGVLISIAGAVGRRKLFHGDVRKQDRVGCFNGMRTHAEPHQYGAAELIRGVAEFAQRRAFLCGKEGNRRAL